MSSSTSFGSGAFGTSALGTIPFFNCKQLIDSVLIATGHQNPAVETNKRQALTMFMNNSYQELCLGREWPWMHASYDFRLQAPYDTGQVTVTQGSDIVTGSGTAWNSTYVPGNIFSLQSKGVIYHIASIDSPTQLTLETLYSEESEADAGYHIAKNQYKLPKETDYLTTFTVNSEVKVRPVGVDTLRLIQLRNGPLTNTPQCYSVVRRDTDDDFTYIEVWPNPDKYYNCQIDYKVRILYLSDTADEYPIIPDRYRTVLYYGMLYQFYQYLRKPEEMTGAFNMFRSFLNRMENDFHMTDGMMGIMPARNYLRRPSASYDYSISLQDFAQLPDGE